ncbi:MAG: DUF2637 domain-containing protein [Propionibacteriaceae bacterium]|jgi:hypothetical protein|nr:DUF2637 domain-containing protein [Propionibacteriaceae bacterium]
MTIRRVPRWVSVFGVIATVLIAAAAFLLSFTALTSLAESAGVTIAWLWPLIVDGLIVAATVSVVTMSGHRGSWYPWLLLIIGAVVSVTANAYHATLAPTRLSPAMAAAVASVPPVVLLASTHLTAMLTRRTARVTSESPKGVMQETPESSEVEPSRHAIAKAVTDPDTHLTGRGGGLAGPDTLSSETGVPVAVARRQAVSHSTDPHVNATTGTARPSRRRTKPKDGDTASGVSAQAQRFVISHLTAHGGRALASKVMDAGRAAGFSTEALKNARRRTRRPSIITVKNTDGTWTWTLDTHTTDDPDNQSSSVPDANETSMTAHILQKPDERASQTGTTTASEVSE